MENGNGKDKIDEIFDKLSQFLNKDSNRLYYVIFYIQNIVNDPDWDSNKPLSSSANATLRIKGRNKKLEWLKWKYNQYIEKNWLEKLVIE